MSSVYDKAAKVAVGEIGVSEATGKNDGVPNSRYADGMVYKDGRMPPWCDLFVRWCYKQAGLEIPGRKERRGNVDYTEGQILLHGLHCKASTAAAHHKFGIPCSFPERGDLIFFRNRADSDTPRSTDIPRRHIGIVEFRHGDWVHTIEGNKSNKVARGKYRLDDKRITSYGRPLPKGGT